MTDEVSVQAIIARLQAEAPINTAGLHRIRRQLSKQMQDMAGEAVIAIAQRLARSTDVPGARMTAYGLVGWHRKALNLIEEGQLEQLAGDLSSWGHVDMFACLLAGRAWRDGTIQNATIHRWAKSKSRWWRRAALASTVPLNVKSQGGGHPPPAPPLEGGWPSSAGAVAMRS